MISEIQTTDINLQLFNLSHEYVTVNHEGKCNMFLLSVKYPDMHYTRRLYSIIFNLTG